MNLLHSIPNSMLKQVLERKVEAQPDRYNDLCSTICRFRSHIVLELRQINELFKEYTPHDEDYHILHLFEIADILLGEESYEKMNVVELCLLIAAMYAHDWGMAVSKSERYYIATHNKKEDSLHINLLDDEFDRFEKFIKTKFDNVVFENDEQISLEIWQDYIRDTHALRSGKRVDTYFRTYNGGFAGALDKICVGHWLEIEDISERNGYYKDTSVLGETVNLIALAIYIRLIDLFDLAEDRTPYVLWKYVNPQNSYSKMEWEKHRALHQITCPSYGNGRIVCISGSTDNHEVYAALMDFKQLCEKYFRECSDTLVHMNDSRHVLGVYLIEWRIEARNFKPITIGFSFEKRNIFKILSDEIYNCHPYIYIRELIQNSIDAIDLRKKILDRKKVGGDNIGHIYFEINRTSINDMDVICRDDGIGMDEYVLKNYFSVLGKSYYNSSDFKSKRIDINAISKFGIGILSCFSVAGQMEILTRREPYMEEGREGLKVVINDIQKTFRIEEIPEYKCEVGTEIKLRIKNYDLEKQLKRNKINIEEYSITEYIKYVANYVKYPIIINENGLKTILIPMNYDIKKLEREVNNLQEYNIYTMSGKYPVEDIVKIQDVDNFNKVFEIRSIDVTKELGIDEIEGNIYFAVIREYQDEIVNETRTWPTDEIIVRRKEENLRIRWNKRNNNNRFLLKNHYINLFNKGICVEAEVGKYDTYRFVSHLFPIPRIRINFPNTISDISVSRFNFKNKSDILDKIWLKLGQYISNELIKLSVDKQGYELWKIIAINKLQYHLSENTLDDKIFKDIEFPFISKEGKLVYDKINEMNRLYFIPRNRYSLVNKFCKMKEDFIEENWIYEKCLLIKGEQRYSIQSLESEISNVIYNVIQRNYYLREMNFVKDEQNKYFIEQEIWEKGDEEYKVKEIIKVLSGYGASYLKDKDKIKKIYIDFLGIQSIVEFSNDYSHYMTYGLKLFNLSNKKVKMLIIYKWILNTISENIGIEQEEIERRKDQLNDLPFFDPYIWDEEKEYSFTHINKELKSLHNWLKMFYPALGEEVVILDKNDFIENSIEMISDDCFKIVKEVWAIE
ncbi:MAG: hypothetical protein HDR19_03160 [Lachnospiraceae bacterium]|nr:hypothetical protein [Lachnospiraceae bacterium]